MICRALRWLLCVGVVGLAFVLPGSAYAYSVGSGSTATGPTGIAAGTPFVFLATFVQPDGTPVPAGQTVTFSQVSGPGTAALPTLIRIGGNWQRIALAASTCQATFNPVTTTTDSAGRASSTVTLPSGCPGQFVLEATLSGGGSVTLTLVETGGFPNTTADPARGLAWWLVAIAALVLGTVAAAGIRLRSVRRGRWN